MLKSDILPASDSYNQWAYPQTFQVFRHVSTVCAIGVWKLWSKTVWSLATAHGTHSHQPPSP